MFHIKNLTKTLRALKPDNTSQKLTRNSSFYINTLPLSGQSFLNRNKNFEHNIKSSFCTTKTEPCGKISDLFEELSETLKNNIQDIRAKLPGRGINVSSFCLNRFGKLCYTEDLSIYDILFKNIEKEIENTNNKRVVFDILEGNFSFVLFLLNN